VTKPKVIPIICGPTGAGKTAIAVELAETYPIEIVSADSRQIIKRLNIGTAKPTPDERSKAAFHLIDIIEPGERYTAFRFIDDADRAIADTLQRRRIPVVVGGAGLYLCALTEGIVKIGKDNLTIREQLAGEMELHGGEQMYNRLSQIDPLEAEKLHPSNKARVIRALEIFYLTGKPKSELIATGAYRKSRHRYSYLCLIPDRQSLYAAIDSRVDGMIQRGLLKEVQNLCQDGLKERVRKANVIGYNESLDYLDGKTTLSEAVSLIKQNTRRYAKRQISWFRHQINGTVFAEASSLRDSVNSVLSNWDIGCEKT